MRLGHSATLPIAATSTGGADASTSFCTGSGVPAGAIARRLRHEGRAQWRRRYRSRRHRPGALPPRHGSALDRACPPARSPRATWRTAVSDEARAERCRHRERPRPGRTQAVWRPRPALCLENAGRNANTKTDTNHSGTDQVKRAGQRRQQVGSLRAHHPSPDCLVQGSRGARPDRNSSEAIFGSKCDHRGTKNGRAVGFFQCVAGMQLG